MNDFLVGTLGFLNALFALAIIGGGAIAGSAIVNDPFFRGSDIEPVAGAVIGGLAGLVVAALVCGLIAAAVNISNRLSQIKRILDRRPL